MYQGLHNYELYELGWVMASAFAEPKQLRKLLPASAPEMPVEGPLKPVSFRGN